jgi:hypothetical protein
MAIAQRFSIMCDEVRQENNGKLIVVGMYTPDMAVFQLPYVCPVLTFLLWLESDTPGNFQFQMAINHLESGKVIVQGMGGVQFAKAGSGITPLRMTGVPFSAAGAYTFSLKFENQDALVTHFGVQLTSPQAGTQGIQRPTG